MLDRESSTRPVPVPRRRRLVGCRDGGRVVIGHVASVLNAICPPTSRPPVESAPGPALTGNGSTDSLTCLGLQLVISLVGNGERRIGRERTQTTDKVVLSEASHSPMEQKLCFRVVVRGHIPVTKPCPYCDGPGGAKTIRNQVAMPINGRVQCIDYCIHHIVAALNAGGDHTLASCCGHGEQPGRIYMEDGRVLEIGIHVTAGHPGWRVTQIGCPITYHDTRADAIQSAMAAAATSGVDLVVHRRDGCVKR